MSINLYLEADSEKIHLWQTPTFITYMCLARATGVSTEADGKKAKRALVAYVEWVKSHTNGAWEAKRRCAICKSVSILRSLSSTKYCVLRRPSASTRCNQKGKNYHGVIF